VKKKSFKNLLKSIDQARGGQVKKKKWKGSIKLDATKIGQEVIRIVLEEILKRPVVIHRRKVKTKVGAR